MVLEEKSDEEIYGFMVQRYGDFVLYDPPVKSSTLMLWLGPFVLLLIGLGVLLLAIRRKPGSSEPEEILSVDESDALGKLLDKKSEKQ